MMTAKTETEKGIGKGQRWQGLGQSDAVAVWITAIKASNKTIIEDLIARQNVIKQR